MSIEVKDRQYTDADFLRLQEESRDPNRHYRWVRIDETNSSPVRHGLKGYVPVLRGEVETIASPESKGEDKIILGDLMLMSCPKEDFERRQEARLKLTQDRINSTTIEAEKKAAERGVRIIKDADHKKETR